MGRAKPKDDGSDDGSDGDGDSDDDGDGKKKKGAKGAKKGGGGGQAGSKAAPHYGPWISNGQLQVLMKNLSVTKMRSCKDIQQELRATDLSSSTLPPLCSARIPRVLTSQPSARGWRRAVRSDELQSSPLILICILLLLPSFMLILSCLCECRSSVSNPRRSRLGRWMLLQGLQLSRRK